jgi:hypothetical protein
MLIFPFTFFKIYFDFVVLMIEARSLGMLGKPSTTKLHVQPGKNFFTCLDI